MFNKQRINNTECWVNGDHLITKQNNKNVYHAYKCTKRDEQGSAISYVSIEKVVTGKDLSLAGYNKETREAITIEGVVYGPKEYLTLEQAMAVCV